MSTRKQLRPHVFCLSVGSLDVNKKALRSRLNSIIEIRNVKTLYFVHICKIKCSKPVNGDDSAQSHCLHITARGAKSLELTMVTIFNETRKTPAQMIFLRLYSHGLPESNDFSPSEFYTWFLLIQNITAYYMMSLT